MSDKKCDLKNLVGRLQNQISYGWDALDCVENVCYEPKDNCKHVIEINEDSIEKGPATMFDKEPCSNPNNFDYGFNGQKFVQEQINPIAYDNILNNSGYKMPGEYNNIPKIRGLMVFYINTSGLSSGEALDLFDKIKAQYSRIEKALQNDNIEVMWLPNGSKETSASYFSFL